MGKLTDMSVELRRSLVRHLQAMIDGRDFAGAVEYFEGSREVLDNAADEHAASALRLVAKAHASLSDYPIALKLARTAQSMAAAQGETLLLAEIFLTVGGILRDMGEFKEAERAFRDAESIFRRQDCLEGQSRALNLLAGLFFHQNDYTNSLTILLDAIEIARKLGDTKKLAFMMGNIGRIYTFIGEFSDAARHLQLNVEMSRELGDELEEARALLSLGYVYIQMAEYDRAEETLKAAYPLIMSQESRYDEAVYLTYLGELQYRMHRYDDSRVTLTAALEKSEQYGRESALTGRALRQLAEVSVRTGDYRFARKFAARAITVLEKADESVEMGAVMKLKAQIAAATGNAGEAIDHFTEAIDRLDRSGVRFEKVDAMVAAASCEAFDRRRRLTWLLRAEEFYSGNRIAVKVEEVGQMIGLLDLPASMSQLSREKSQVDFLTANAEIRRIKKQMQLVASSDLPVLLTGETGVGKDHMARYYHSLARPGGPYVTINCASVPETLLESELFGYQRGAFTGADHEKPGLFVNANGGVVYLDEIGDMPMSLQAKLLGVLERRRVVPLGGTKEIELDFKLIAATNKDLEAMVEEGSFRRDLFYRLSGIAFHIPALRKRKEDIPVLLSLFMQRAGLVAPDEQLPSELLHHFVEYDWPGNVRELRNKVKRLELMADRIVGRDFAGLADSLFGGPDISPESGASSLFDRVEEFERQLLLEAVLAAQGNKSEAARLLGIHEATVRTKLKRYGISLDNDRIAVNMQ